MNLSTQIVTTTWGFVSSCPFTAVSLAWSFKTWATDRGDSEEPYQMRHAFAALLPLGIAAVMDHFIGRPYLSPVLKRRIPQAYHLLTHHPLSTLIFSCAAYRLAKSALSETKAGWKEGVMLTTACALRLCHLRVARLPIWLR